MAYVVKNKKGEYWTGKMQLPRPFKNWEFMISPDENEAAKFSSKQDAIKHYHGNCSHYRIGLYAFFIDELKEEKPKRNFCEDRNTINDYLTEHPYKHPNGWQTEYSPAKHTTPPTITEICKEADRCKDDRYRLLQLFKTVVDQRNSYSDIDYNFIHEHIRGYIAELDAKAVVNQLIQE